MIIYAVIPVILFFLGRLFSLDNNKKKRIFLFFVFLVLFLIMGLRSPDIGTDTQIYIDIFNDLRVKKFSSYYFGNKMMYLYSIYNIIVGTLFPFEQTIIITNSLIICILSAIFIYRVCNKHVALSTTFFVLLYFYFSAFNTARQYIAILLVANSIFYLINKCSVEKPVIKYLLLVTCAFFVHNTAIVALLLLPLFFINKKDYLTYFVFCLFIIFFSLPFLPTVISKLFPDYASYFENVGPNNFNSLVSKGRTAILYLTNLFFLSIAFFIISKLKLNVECRLLLSVSIFSSFISLVFNTNILVTRIISYFNIFTFAALPHVSDAFRGKSKTFVVYALFVIYFIPFFIQLKGHYSGIIDYKFFR